MGTYFISKNIDLDIWTWT